MTKSASWNSFPSRPVLSRSLEAFKDPTGSSLAQPYHISQLVLPWAGGWTRDLLMFLPTQLLLGLSSIWQHPCKDFKANSLQRHSKVPSSSYKSLQTKVLLMTTIKELLTNTGLGVQKCKHKQCLNYKEGFSRFICKFIFLLLSL